MTNNIYDEKQLATIVFKTCYGYSCDNINFTRLESASPNINWLVQNNDYAFVLRKCMINNNQDYFNYLEQIIDLLNSYGIPVPQLIMAKDGQKEVYCEGNWWQLRLYIDGRPYKTSDISDALETAKLLCKLHTIPVSNIETIHFIHDPYYWLLNPDKEIENLEYFLKTNRKDKDEVIKKYKLLVKDALKYIDIERYNILNRSIIHGDFHGNNLVFVNNSISGLLDFDFISVNARIIDVAQSVYLMARKQRGSFVLDKNIILKYLEIYNECHKLSHLEYHAMIPLLQLRLLPRSEYLVELDKKAPHLLNWQLEWSLNAASHAREQLIEAIKIASETNICT
ncbi:MAG: hypothetical protein K0S01_2446 [Herbinix sp.]|jgi:homoserine kinase type II|nr:hypothetical protein [Herbinix sp.]